MKRLISLLTLPAAIAALGPSTAAALSSPALPAQVVSIQRPTALVAYPTVDYGKNTRAGSTTWRSHDSSDTSQLNQRARGASLRVTAASKASCTAINCRGSSEANTPKLKAYRER